MLGRDKHFSLLAFIISKREKSLITMTPLLVHVIKPFSSSLSQGRLSLATDQSDQKIEQKFAQHLEM
jgi:hypothetical protein